MPFRQGERCGEVVEIAATGDFFSSETHYMRRGLLAVDDAESERAAKERVEAKNRELLLEIEQLKKRLGE